MNLRHIPNFITALRLVLVIPVVVLLIQRRFTEALLVFAVAGASDVLDGFLARRYGWFTRLGGWLDPVADKIMLVSTYVTLVWLGLIPFWLLAMVIARDVTILMGGVVYYFWVEKVDAQPSWISKLNTVAQIALVMAVMFDRGVAALPIAWLEVMIGAVTLTTALSGAGYVATWGARAIHVRRGGT